MTNTVDRLKSDMKALVAMGVDMQIGLSLQTPNAFKGLSKEEKESMQRHAGAFELHYQRWYTEAGAAIRQLIPDRSAEFCAYYLTDPKRKTVSNLTFSIQDWLTGSRSKTDFQGEKYFDDIAIVTMRFQAQRGILDAASKRFESSLLDIRQVLQADLFDTELEMARELIKKGFLRPSGVIAGVVLERHLGGIAAAHGVAPRKKDPGIGDFNDALKANSTIEVPIWRFIQRLGDLRNLAAHNKERDPTSDEMKELIDGVERVSKTVF